MSSGNKRRPWERQERHYCQYCNVWMGSDRQSILLHENGQKHKAAVDRHLQDKRAAQAEQESSAALLQRSLAQMDAAAQQARANDAPYYQHPGVPPPVQSVGVHSAPYHPFSVPSASLAPAAISSLMAPPPPPPSQQPSSHKNNQAPAAQEKRQWEDRKKHRREDNARKRRERRGKDGEGGGESDDDENENDRGGDSSRQDLNATAKRLKLDPAFGHYASSVDPTQLWLEGDAFGERLVEEDMPVQVWTGPVLATSAEKRLADREIHWKDALILAVRRHRSSAPIPPAVDKGDSNVGGDGSEAATTTAAAVVVVDLAYLESPDAEQETVVKSVPLHQIRMLLGHPKDDRIPETLEEARILAQGGIVEEVSAAAQGGAPSGGAAVVDEATGLSSWTTVSVKKTTVRLEEREERERQRQKRKEAEVAAQREAKRAEERKMEEAKVSNADDSALGAYDVWNRGEKEGYKGVNIHAEAKVDVHDLGKKLAEKGAVVPFKKPAFKSKAKKQMNRRTTSADD